MLSSMPVRRIVALALGYLMIAHFLFGIFLTARLMIGVGAYAAYLWFMLPYVGILSVFLLGVLLAHLHRLRWAAVSLLLGLGLSVGVGVYDLANVRCQIQGGGVGATYTIWWWYYEPFWYGYEPGTI